MDIFQNQKQIKGRSRFLGGDVSGCRLMEVWLSVGLDNTGVESNRWLGNKYCHCRYLIGFNEKAVVFGVLLFKFMDLRCRLFESVDFKTEIKSPCSLASCMRMYWFEFLLPSCFGRSDFTPRASLGKSPNGSLVFLWSRVTRSCAQRAQQRWGERTRDGNGRKNTW